jgi:transposase
MESTAAVTTIAIDLAKEVFQLALADASCHVVRSLRLKRAEFLAFWSNHAVVHVVMEACGSAHHFGRWLSAMGHRVTLLPAQYVRPYVRRNKTDKADCAALLEALRSSDIKPVPIKSEYHQVIQLMHRARQQWQHDRTARINLARGMLREFGVVKQTAAVRPEGVPRQASNRGQETDALLLAVRQMPRCSKYISPCMCVHRHTRR